MDWSHAVRIMVSFFIFLLWSPIVTCNIYYGYRRYRDPKTSIAPPIAFIGSILGIAMILVPPYLSVPLRLAFLPVILLLSDGSWYLGSTLSRPHAV